MAEITDEQLMLDFQAGKKDSITVIFSRYKTPVFNFCLRILGNRPDAEDITGDVFLKLFSSPYSVNPQAKFSTYLYTIARNGCMDRIRKRKFSVSMWFTKENGEEEKSWEVPDPSPTSRDVLQEKESAKTVRKAINDLPLEQKEALILREYQSLSYDQIAVVLGCSLDKVKILIFRARENLSIQLSSLIKEEIK